VYDATTTAAGTAIVTGGTLFGSDTISGGTFAFVSKNAGTNVTVNVSGVTVNDGNAGGNYAVTHVANNTSNITRAPLALNAVGDTRVYDGTTNSAGTVGITGLMGTDTITGLSQHVCQQECAGRQRQYPDRSTPATAVNDVQRRQQLHHALPTPRPEPSRQQR
jgi:hypothetical protein